MIGVMFRFNDKITTDEGNPVTKVFMFGKEFSRPVGVKQNGVRPLLAYVFRVQGMENDIGDVDELMDWLHKSISYALHPTEGKIVYQNQDVANLFKL